MINKNPLAACMILGASLLSQNISASDHENQINYDIDSKASVISSFYNDENNGLFADLPIEIIEKILAKVAKAGNTKSLHFVSKWFNALFMSGILPIQFEIIGSGYDKNTTDFTQEDIARFSNVQKTVCSISRLEDVSDLGTVQNLTLKGLFIKDVSDLGTVQNLTLEGLLITDVSALGNVPNLRPRYLFGVGVVLGWE